MKLNADYSAVSYSGHGIISGYTSGEKNTDSLIPDCYELTGKLSDYASAWNFDDHSNDVVVINLGTNDSSYVSKDTENRAPEFVEGYADFLKTVREKNPDAEYILNIDPDKGGNAVSFVGYDKSFLINMVTGGESAAAIEAVISGVSLKNGGGYRLEFDYTSTADATLPVLVTCSDGKVFFESEVDAVSEKNHFSAEFTADSDDTAASIIFQLGGKGYYNVTLSNISLVKIS